MKLEALKVKPLDFAFEKEEEETHSVMPFLTIAPSPSFWSFARTFLITSLGTLLLSEEIDMVMMMMMINFCYVIFSFFLTKKSFLMEEVSSLYPVSGMCVNYI